MGTVTRRLASGRIKTLSQLENMGFKHVFTTAGLTAKAIASGCKHGTGFMRNEGHAVTLTPDVVGRAGMKFAGSYHGGHIITKYGHLPQEACSELRLAGVVPRAKPKAKRKAAPKRKPGKALKALRKPVKKKKRR